MNRNVLLPILERLERLEQRARQGVLRGRVHDVDTERPALKVNYGSDEEPLLTDWLSLIAHRNGKHGKTWWCPEKGEPIVVLSNGDLTQGVVLPAAYVEGLAPSQDAELALMQWSEGALASYHRGDKHLVLTLPSGATASITVPERIEITSKLVHLNGRLHVTENISSDADVIDSVRSMAADRTIYNGHVHVPTTPKTTPPEQKQ
ncbi:phage baseplate assembly protein [Vibrio variabilis]|uniref:Phage baseplate assembly protein n=1 Tax=Vibrio variabilis TaxID=990271 RepID=A0ABQ0JR33_9VIBR|nr:phage baseplate assembly protein [Vibrio variabilis]